MPHRLSPRESRRLLRQFLPQDEEREPRGGMLFAFGRPHHREPAASIPPDRATGPYEAPYAILDGYTTERTVIVP